jgi:hypothetical protein
MEKRVIILIVIIAIILISALIFFTKIKNTDKKFDNSTCENLDNAITKKNCYKTFNEYNKNNEENVNNNESEEIKDKEKIENKIEGMRTCEEFRASCYRFAFGDDSKKQVCYLLNEKCYKFILLTNFTDFKDTAFCSIVNSECEKLEGNTAFCAKIKSSCLSGFNELGEYIDRSSGKRTVYNEEEVLDNTNTEPESEFFDFPIESEENIYYEDSNSSINSSNYSLSFQTAKSVCDTMEDPLYKIICYRAIGYKGASNTADIPESTSCEQIGDSTEQTKCFWASKTVNQRASNQGSQRDLLMCRNITNEQLKQQCYYNILGDPKFSDSPVPIDKDNKEDKKDEDCGC